MSQTEKKTNPSHREREKREEGNGSEPGVGSTKGEKFTLTLGERERKIPHGVGEARRRRRI